MTTVNVSATETINAPVSTVWDRLSDFQNWHDWTSQIKSIEQTTEATNGVGAGRACQLAPAGSTSEKVLEWVPEERMVISLFDVKLLPIKESTSTFTLRSLGPDSTEITMAPAVVPKGGIMAPFIGKRLSKRLPKAAAGLLGDLKASVEK